MEDEIESTDIAKDNGDSASTDTSSSSSNGDNDTPHESDNDNDVFESGTAAAGSTTIAADEDGDVTHVATPTTEEDGVVGDSDNRNLASTVTDNRIEDTKAAKDNILATDTSNVSDSSAASFTTRPSTSDSMTTRTASATNGDCFHILAIL